MILAGDIGGTNSRLAFFSERSGRLEFVVEATYPSQDHANLETIAGEGGHASFAPIDPVQIELLNFLRHEFGEVSWERVVSGPGLHNIYRFLRDTGRGEEPDWLARQMRQPDPSAVISQAALAGTSTLCRQALDLFVALYGAEAGNLALTLMATAGVYVGGGIAPKIIQKLTDSTFLDAFVAKGRLKPLLQQIPIQVIMNDQVALLGAARFAMRQTS
jgi:glucokinase